MTVGGLTSIYSISLELVLPIQLLISALSDLSAIQDIASARAGTCRKETVTVVECSADQPVLAVRQRTAATSSGALTLQPGKRCRGRGLIIGKDQLSGSFDRGRHRSYRDGLVR